MARREISVLADSRPAFAADGVGMWRQKARVAERPIDADRATRWLGAVDVRILHILEAAGAGQSLSHARRPTDDLAVMLTGSGASTFSEFDSSLALLSAQGLIELDKDGFACLSKRGRDLTTKPDTPFNQTQDRKATGSAVP